MVVRKDKFKRKVGMGSLPISLLLYVFQADNDRSRCSKSNKVSLCKNVTCMSQKVIRLEDCLPPQMSWDGFRARRG